MSATNFFDTRRAMKVCFSTSLWIALSCHAAPMVGKFDLYFIEYRANMNSVQIPIDGVNIDTGPLTITLDKSNPASQRETIDLDLMRLTYSMDLLVYGEALGLPGQRLHIDGSGQISNPILISNSAGSYNLLFDVMGITNSGAFGDGQFFTGFTYENLFGGYKHDVEVKYYPDGQIESYKEKTNVYIGPAKADATLTQIDKKGNKIETSVSLQGEQHVETRGTPISEPATLAMALTGFWAMAATRRQKAVTKAVSPVEDNYR